jgi:hypothetical protein
MKSVVFEHGWPAIENYKYDSDESFEAHDLIQASSEMKVLIKNTAY